MREANLRQQRDPTRARMWGVTVQLGASLRTHPSTLQPLLQPNPADTFASQISLACSLLWQQRASLVHDLKTSRACASWEVAELAPPGVALPPAAALDAVNSLLSRLRAAAGEAAWQQTAEAVEQAFDAAEGEAGLLSRLFPNLSVVMCVATGVRGCVP